MNSLERKDQVLNWEWPTPLFSFHVFKIVVTGIGFWDIILEMLFEVDISKTLNFPFFFRKPKLSLLIDFRYPRVNEELQHTSANSGIHGESMTHTLTVYLLRQKTIFYILTSTDILEC